MRFARRARAPTLVAPPSASPDASPRVQRPPTLHLGTAHLHVQGRRLAVLAAHRVERVPPPEAVLLHVEVPEARIRLTDSRDVAELQPSEVELFNLGTVFLELPNRWEYLLL